MSGLKALIVLSDMRDNGSHHTREEATSQAQRSAIVIYPILLGEVQARNGEVAKLFAGQTGGVPFLIEKGKALKEAFGSIRADLDHTYMVAYRPKLKGPNPIKFRCTRKGTRIFAPDRRF